MTKSIIKEEIVWRGGKYELELFEGTDFQNLSPITQVYGFIFNDQEELLIVKGDGNDWGLPGGTPESYDKDWRDTLIREVDEEANVDINNILPVGYLWSKAKDERNGKKDGYALRAVARVKRIKRRKIDPASGEIDERKFIQPKEFLNYCKWNENGKLQLEMALKARREMIVNYRK